MKSSVTAECCGAEQKLKHAIEGIDQMLLEHKNGASAASEKPVPVFGAPSQ